MIEPLLEEIVRRCAGAEAVALCSVVAARGSTPQAAGAHMLLLANGQQVGTLGGGCVEAEVRQQALKLLEARRSKLLTFKLDHDYGWDDGLICGGTMEILVQTLLGADSARPFAAALEAIRAGRQTQFEINYQLESLEARTYSESLEPAPQLLIAGAGHVGQALARLGADAGFEVVIFDDRADLTSTERFPAAKERIIGEIEDALARYPIDERSYVVIVTRGHKHDGHALLAVINSPARYIGLIGSKRKVKTIFEDLVHRGVALEKLLRVHAPIGLEIGAVTVPEIAVSIAAELIAVRRGRENVAAGAMKFDEEMLRKLLEGRDGRDSVTR